MRKINKNAEKAYMFSIESNITYCDFSYVGGTLKIDVSSLFDDYINGYPAIMGAYQNYLGGGMRGAIVGASMFRPSDLNDDDREVYDILIERIKRYAHAITNNDDLDMNDEWNTMSYERQQSLPASAY